MVNGTTACAPARSLSQHEVFKLFLLESYIGKDETVAIERVNSRLRHWFARFRRRTCVVSKALEMVDATIALFAAYHVNRTATKLTLPLLA